MCNIHAHTHRGYVWCDTDIRCIFGRQKMDGWMDEDK